MAPKSNPRNSKALLGRRIPVSFEVIRAVEPLFAALWGACQASSRPLWLQAARFKLVQEFSVDEGLFLPSSEVYLCSFRSL